MKIGAPAAVATRSAPGVMKSVVAEIVMASRDVRSRTIVRSVVDEFTLAILPNSKEPASTSKPIW